HPTRAARDLTARHRPSTRHDLVDDLRGREVAGEPGLPRRAERTVHAAARLARDADRDAIAAARGGRPLDEIAEPVAVRLFSEFSASRHPAEIAHQHRLDERSV